MPPQDFGLLGDLKAAGLDTISFDTECTSSLAFEKYCPGKAKSYGFASMHRALDAALGVFGKHNVFTIVIAGIEPLDEFYIGICRLIERGITPTINIYHHDPLTTKMDVGEPDPIELVAFATKLTPKFIKHDVRPGALGCSHYDIGHDIKKGFFHD
jgi:hypothetical protein